MPLDAVYIAQLRQELADRLAGCRIDRVRQPERDTVLLSLRGAGEMLGRRQHGEAQFIHADGEGDFRLLQKAMEDLPVIKVDFPCEYAMIKKKAEARSAEQEIVLN